ncbi:saccharopine dehydrogenase family protein [Actinophytocola sediminis]
MTETAWLLYGANGYTGELIAREAANRGLRPILAGRNASRIAALAAELGLEHRAFDLADPEEIASGLTDVDIVLHCAGPFSATSAPMVEACLRTGTHYLDISGEIEVFEHAATRHARARRDGVVLCPGVGFDVVPTDCVAARLHEELPTATALKLGFDVPFRLSPGTFKTIVEGLSSGGRVRVDGRIIAVPQAWRTRRIDFGAGEKLAMTFPAADVSSAFHTTAIPDIEVYVRVRPTQLGAVRLGNLLRPVLARPTAQRVLKWLVARTVRGPATAARDARPVRVWGEVTDAEGERRTARITTANLYSITVDGALAAVDVLRGNPPAGGYLTPAQLLGADVVTKLPGSGPLTVD